MLHPMAPKGETSSEVYDFVPGDAQDNKWVCGRYAYFSFMSRLLSNSLAHTAECLQYKGKWRCQHVLVFSTLR